MRLFTYMCPHCHGATDQEFPGTEPPPNEITYPHDCPQGTEHQQLLRVWRSTRLNLGYRPVVHSPNDLWAFQNG